MLNFVLALATLPLSMPRQDPVTATNPGLVIPFSEPQNVEGLLLAAPSKLEKINTTNESYRAYQAVIQSQTGDSTGITEIVSVVVTDLDKLETKPTADQICDLHDRASRTRAGFAGQLFKSERTELNGRPMIVLMGSMVGKDTNQKNLNIYQISAALSTEAKAYEITWFTYYGGDSFSNAVKSVRSASLQENETIHAPKHLFGTNGEYTLLGTPYKFVLPKPTLARAEPEITENQSQLYIGELSEDEWYTTVEIAELKESMTDYSPQNLLTLLGYPEWNELNPKFELQDTIQVCPRIELNENRHARIEIAGNGSRIYALIVSAPKDKPLPDRTKLSLKQ